MRPLQLATLAVHAGDHPDPHTKALEPPVVLASAYAFDSADRRYVDYVMAYGPLLFGHTHIYVTATNKDGNEVKNCEFKFECHSS